MMRINEERKKVFWRVLSDAAFDRLNLGMLGAIAGTSVVFQTAPFFVLATGGYISVIAAELLRPDSWRRAAKALRSEPPDLPAASAFDSPTVRDLLFRLERARAQRTCLSGRPELARQPRQAEVAEQAAELEAAVVRALVALDRVTGYLAEQSAALLRKEETRLEQLADDATKPETQADYKAALEMLAVRQQVIADMADRRDAIHAKLEAMVGFLEMVPVELMKLDVLESSNVVLDEKAAVLGLVEEVERMEYRGQCLGRA